MRDRLGTFGARMGFTRYDYKVVPGLYCIGDAGPDSPVIVTANYKLTFDVVRKELSGQSVWLLILDTRGINVWCAAGKHLFSTEELARQIILSGLADVVRQRQVIIPQLGATGISAHKLRKMCGFTVVYGPVQASDLKAFINSDLRADEAMRTVTFTLRERAVLIPVEIWMLKKYVVAGLALIFVLSGIGNGIFSLEAAWSRGSAATAILAAGILAGAFLAPLLLPWLPGRQFWLKGIAVGLPATLAVSLLFMEALGVTAAMAMALFATMISSHLCMNFTGSTPYTSPSGVEKEMRRGLPIQILASIAALFTWVGTGFL